MAENTIEIDFEGSEPVQSTGGRSDRIPEGTYVLEIDSVRKTESKNGKPMISIWYEVVPGKYPGGEFAGKRIMDNFVLPRPGTEDSHFGLDRFHGLLIAIGAPKQAGRANINLDQLKKKKIVSEVRDDEYNDTITSKPVSFYATNSSDAAELLSQPAPTPPPAPAAVEAPATPAPAVAAASAAPDTVPAAEPAPAAPAATDGLFDAPATPAPATPAPTPPPATETSPAPASAVTEAEQQLDELFGGTS